ncbi:MAG: ABC transporter permease [Muribaculaceae bacterium]|nr:ABC transporter permease [Muribaculaceae bacterium]
MILRVALRYLFAKKSHKVVNVISFISMAGVAVATMAIVVVLSVFNGFSDLARRHLSLIDPDIKVVPVGAKVMRGDSIVEVVEGISGVAAAMPILQERALLATATSQMPIIVKGIDSERVDRVIAIDSIIIDGIYSSENGLPDSVAGVQLSTGVAISTGLRPSPYSVADIYMPRRLGRINPANPAAAYRSLAVAVTGVFQVDQPEYDAEYVFAPLNEVRRMLEYYDGEASAVEVKVARGVSIADVVGRLKEVLGPNFAVLDRDHQQAETFRMISVEKWVTFLMLAFILLIASFNIVSTLSLMVIEKRDNMTTLRALGASKKMVDGIFVAEGWLITAVGGIMGVLFGVVLSLVQQHFGIVKLGADPTTLTIDVYPVILSWTDVAMVFGTVFVVGFVVAQISRVFTRKID